jgi:hypothetical protein
MPVIFIVYTLDMSEAHWENLPGLGRTLNIGQHARTITTGARMHLKPPIVRDIPPVYQHHQIPNSYEKKYEQSGLSWSGILFLVLALAVAVVMGWQIAVQYFS